MEARVMENGEKGKEIFCGIDLHDRSMLCALGIGKEAPMEELKKVNRELEQLSGGDAYRVKVSVLRELPGVGLLTAMVFLTELGDLRRFKNRRALANYLGLTPRSYESGERDDRKGHISKLGPARVRKVLNQAAWALIRLDRYWRKWYEGDGRAPQHERKRRITAVMRRLGILMWHWALEAEPGAQAA